MRCFIEGVDKSFFPLSFLPYGVFKPALNGDHSSRDNNEPRIGTAIGDYVLDLALLEKEGLISENRDLFNHDSLNYFASKGKQIWDQIRTRLQSLLSKNNTELQHNTALLKKALYLQSDVTMLLPFKTQGFTDFYASIHHASNVGRLFRGNENPLLPNWKYLPVAYNGRASTLFPSGTRIKRPKGQIKLPDQEQPIFTSSRKLDFELEMGIFIGVGNKNAEPIHIANASDHIFGLTLLNDWSARDIQAFEYQPLGPFLSKSFATSVSHWVVPIAALAPFKKPLPKQNPVTVEYLQTPNLNQYDIMLRVEIIPHGSNQKTLLCETNYSELYWSMEQMLAHHTINNCIMHTGDLLGSGTISGNHPNSWGSLLELSFNGTKPIKLSDGQTRSFLEDGDKIIMTGFCENDEFKMSFGSLEGTITKSD